MGSLHRCANDSLEHVPLLEQVLEECPHLYLVVSSDWRRTCSIAYLQSVFSPAYRHRANAQPRFLAHRFQATFARKSASRLQMNIIFRRSCV